MRTATEFRKKLAYIYIHLVPESDCFVLVFDAQYFMRFKSKYDNNLAMGKIKLSVSVWAKF